MITVTIPYEGNKMGLAQLLVSLQPQLHPDDDIYIVDFSQDKSALQIAKLYGSTRCYIMVEPTDKTFIEALGFGLQSMKENKQKGVLILETELVIPTTFIANLKKSIKADYELFLLDISDSTEMDPNFKWFNPIPAVVDFALWQMNPNARSMYIKATAVNEKFGLHTTKPIYGLIKERVVKLPIIKWDITK